MNTLEMVVAEKRKVSNRRKPTLTGASPLASSFVSVGRLVGFSEEGFPLVDFSSAGQAQPRPARSTVSLTENEIGRELVLIFEGGDSEKPIVTGVVQPPLRASVVDPATQVHSNEKQIALSAEEEIVLRCGRSSITLTRAGKVIIRGAYLLSRSSGVNRIKGGSVQIN